MHAFRAGWRSPLLSARSLVGFGTVSIFLLVIFILMSDWRAACRAVWVAFS